MNPEDEYFDEGTGIQYYAVDIEYGKRTFPICDGCVGEHDSELCDKLPMCAANMREDGIPVIFVEAKSKIRDE